MEKFSNWIVRKRFIFLIAIGVLAVISVVLMFFVEVNYDATKYLPEDLNTKKALVVMEEEFGITGSGQIMIENVTIQRAHEIKRALVSIPGVMDILWIDNFLDEELLLGLDDLLNESFLSNYLGNIPMLNQFYKDNKALFQVVFQESDHSKVTDGAIVGIRSYLNSINYPYAMGGSAVETYNARHITESEVTKITIMVIPIFILILLLFTKSFMEPFIFILVIGISVLINMGTNAIFPNISFLTQSTAVLLQFAVSMDYAIFLLHRYNDVRLTEDDPVKAMSIALKKSFIPVSSSALTTMASFVALMFMRYTLGLDMALVLIKGVILSLLCVFLLMPAVIILSEKYIRKTEHKDFTPNLKKFSIKILNWKLIIPVIILLLTIPAFLAQKNNTFLYGNSAMSVSEASAEGREAGRIESEFGKSNPIVLLLPLEIDSEDLIDYTKERTLIKEISDSLMDANIAVNVQAYSTMTDLKSFFPELPGDLSNNQQMKDAIVVMKAWFISNGYGNPDEWITENLIPKELKDNLVSENYSRIMISIATEAESEEAYQAIGIIESKANINYTGKYYLLGVSTSIKEIQEVVEADYNLVNMASIILVIVILGFALRSLLLPFILVFVIQISIWFNMSIPYFSGDSLIFIGYLIVSSIQLGATIDYGILLTSRFMENRKLMNKKRAISEAIVQSGNSILTSCLIMASAGFVLGLTSSIQGVASLGILIGRGAILSGLLVLVLLPLLLYYFDNLIKKLTFKPAFFTANRAIAKSKADKQRKIAKKRLEENEFMESIEDTDDYEDDEDADDGDGTSDEENEI